jgi:hypothetical protein
MRHANVAAAAACMGLVLLLELGLLLLKMQPRKQGECVANLSKHSVTACHITHQISERRRALPFLSSLLLKCHRSLGCCNSATYPGESNCTRCLNTMVDLIMVRCNLRTCLQYRFQKPTRTSSRALSLARSNASLYLRIDAERSGVSAGWRGATLQMACRGSSRSSSNHCC